MLCVIAYPRDFKTGYWSAIIRLTNIKTDAIDKIIRYDLASIFENARLILPVTMRKNITKFIAPITEKMAMTSLAYGLNDHAISPPTSNIFDESLSLEANFVNFGPVVSEAARFCAPLPSVGSREMVNTSIPIPPSQLLVAFHRSRAFGILRIGIMNAPEVVQPAVDSNNESIKLKSRPAKKYGREPSKQTSNQLRNATKKPSLILSFTL